MQNPRRVLTLYNKLSGFFCGNHQPKIFFEIPNVSAACCCLHLAAKTFGDFRKRTLNDATQPDKFLQQQTLLAKLALPQSDNMSSVLIGWFSANVIITIGFTTLEALSLLALIHAVARCAICKKDVTKEVIDIIWIFYTRGRRSHNTSKYAIMIPIRLRSVEYLWWSLMIIGSYIPTPPHATTRHRSEGSHRQSRTLESAPLDYPPLSTI